MPDIYELYAKNSSNSLEKYSYASVPDIKTSKLLKELLSKNKNILIVECKYNNKFKKWVPIKESSNIDYINTINKIQSMS